MRSLNTSLPKSPRRKRSSQPPEQLIQAFKTAALSVTNLYKTAATDQKATKETGYQEALDDLLTFLDRENIGLDDGEGWRIRQWATERLDGSPPAFTASDDEEERVDVASGARSSALNTERTADRDQARQPSRSSSPTQPAAAPAPRSASTTAPLVVNMQTPNEVFSFRSAHSFPPDVDGPLSDGTETNRTPSSPQTQTQTRSASAVRVEVVARGSRTSLRGCRNTARSTTNVRVPTSITGSKRRLPFPDYFDIGNLGDGKDGQGGGGKRGRFV